MTVTSLMTADELLNRPDDGYRYELVRGELRKMSPSGLDHGIVGARIIGSLIAHAESTGSGVVTNSDAGFRIGRNPDTVLAPDAAFISNERLVRTTKFSDGPPDVAFEVVSPSDRYSEVGEKIQEWLRAGTQVVVVVDPRTRSVQIYRAGGAETVTDTIVIDDILPGWRMPLSKLFE
jgi:Uma2 family endonuclease